MRLTEPMTLATDYLLAILGCWLGLRLWRAASRPGDPRRIWAAAFWATSAAAALGGSSHGFAEYLSARVDLTLWNATMLAIGLASGLLVQAAVGTVAPATTAGPRLRRAAGWVLAVEVAAYALWVCLVDNDFRLAVAQYGVAMSILLVVHLVPPARRHPGAWWVVAGIAVSFLGAWIQQSGFAPHPSFNHNDLYHVVQMVGLWWLYLGARLPERR